jgi:phosphatidylglycerophosphate synthase
MFDASLRTLIDPPLNRLGQSLARRGVTAAQVTAAGAVCSVVAMALIALGWTGPALVPLLAARMADGLDGAVARATRLTDLGGLYDVVADYVFYGLIPLGFILADPGLNGAAGAVLLVSFYVNGGSFLAFAALAARRGLSTQAQGVKAIYYSGGLLEGAETIGFFIILCLWPTTFATLAWAFAALCFLSAGLRVRMAMQMFGD